MQQGWLSIAVVTWSPMVPFLVRSGNGVYLPLSLSISRAGGLPSFKPIHVPSRNQHSS
ncbi:MAG: hypothetical protein ACI87O_003006 [Planctomycetota bacterium]|jgi:hypothetical protein